MKRFSLNRILWVLVPLQLLCTSFFIWDITASLLRLRSEPISWALREMIEIGAAIGLLLGLAIGTTALYRALQRNKLIEQRLRAASGALADLMEERFVDWGLTPAERDVAWFTVKGFSNAEIAGLRNTSEGTVKAQSNAIFRKSGVSGRSQLLGLFIEDLLADIEHSGRDDPETSKPAG
ncbi:MAG: LuxR C-terminal-related transcriptional regulator [Pseudomonadota bacterium]